MKLKNLLFWRTNALLLGTLTSAWVLQSSFLVRVIYIKLPPHFFVYNVVQHSRKPSRLCSQSWSHSKNRTEGECLALFISCWSEFKWMRFLPICRWRLYMINPKARESWSCLSCSGYFVDVQPFIFPNLPLPVICLFVTLLSLTLLSIHSVIVLVEKCRACLPHKC